MFHQDFQIREIKTDESTRPLRPSAFIVFEFLEIAMKHDARGFAMTSLKKQYKIMQCCILPFFFEKPCMCDLLYSVGVYCICELLFLIIQ